MSTDHEIDDGLDRLTSSTTAADLVRDRGEGKPVRVMSKRRLKELVSSAATRELSTFAERIGPEACQRMVEAVARRVKRQLDHLKNDERELQGIQAEAEAIEERVQATLGENPQEQPVLVHVQELSDLLAHAMRLAQYSLHDANALKEEMQALRSLDGQTGPASASAETEAAPNALGEARARARQLLELAALAEDLAEHETVLDLAVAVDEADSATGLDPLCTAVYDLLARRLNSGGD